MKRKRSIAAILMACFLVLAAVGCSSGQTPSDTSSPAAETSTGQESTGQTEATQAPEAASAAENNTTDAAGGNVLVAYYSYTGTTEGVAQQIADLTGGTLAEIQRVEDYGDLQEEAEAEINDGVRPEITVSVDNVEDYDTIFVGYPIWWDEAPAMIATFLESYDFAGKTIVPFCTSASDDIDNSLHIFEEICPDAAIAEALTANDAEEIEPWIERLGLLNTADASDSSAQTDEQASAQSGSNILIAYFSVPETDGVDTVSGASRIAVDGDVLGNNQYVAQLIQQETGGDLFAIETEQQYPGTHDALLEFAYEERSNDARPALASQIENLDNYDTIFLGYPNWNADLPMPLYTFLEENDFSGKTIIPFTTHGGSGFSGTIDTIAELQPDATVVEDGLSIYRDDVPDAPEEVQSFIAGLDY